MGGKEESTILIHGGKAPAPNAAMVNSIMARALDFDNGMRNGMHISASTVPTALASAELCGRINGKEFLTALIAGEDLAVRVNLATNINGFDTTGVHTLLGTTTIASRLLGLDYGEMLNALGIAFNQAGGSFQSNIDGALVVRVIQGFTSRSGITSAVLAKRGITGVKNIMQGIYGYFHLFSKDEFNEDTLMDGLGETFGQIHFGFKKYPSCGGTLAATEEALCLVKEHNIKPQDIDEVVVSVSQRIFNLVGQPFNARDNPEVDAQFSLQYTVANAILRQSSKLEHFTAQFVKDAEVVELAQRIKPCVSTEVERAGPHAMLLEMRLKNGRTLSKYRKHLKGFPEDPLTENELREKFRDCVAFAPRVFPAATIDQIIATVERLEEQDDVRELIRLLAC